MRCDFSWSAWLRRNYLACGMASVLSVCTLVGCGRGTPAASTENDGKSESDHSKSDETPKSTGKKSEMDGGRETVPVNPNRRMVADIPLDVFFDNPIAESKKTGEVASPAAGPAIAATKPMPGDAGKPATEPMPTADKPPESPASGAGEWATLISAEDLQDEVKKIRLRLQDNLSAIGKYNAHYNKEIVWDAAGLAALAGIAMVHPDNVSWKAHAGQVRDVAKELVVKAKGGLGQKPFEATKKEFEKIDGLLAGNPPPGLPEAAADVPFSEVASRKHLMYCIQNGSEYLRANSAAAGPFEKASEDIARSASLMAAYCKVVGTEGYNGADEDDYKNFMKPLFEDALKMAKAAREKDFAVFSEATGRMPKYCTECHGTYAGNTN